MTDFAVALRGYDRDQVDAVLGRAEAAAASEDRGLRRRALEELRSASFPQRLRGYDRDAVDSAIHDLARRLT